MKEIQRFEDEVLGTVGSGWMAWIYIRGKTGEREGTKTRGRPEEVSQCFGWKPFKENGEKRTEKGSIKIVLVSASRPLY